MPAQQGLGGDQEGSPTLPREQAAERRQDRSICRSIPHTCVELTFENTDLVPEDHDLDIFVRLASPAGQNKSEDVTHAEVEEGEGHDG